MRRRARVGARGHGRPRARRRRRGRVPRRRWRWRTPRSCAQGGGPAGVPAACVGGLGQDARKPHFGLACRSATSRWPATARRSALWVSLDSSPQPYQVLERRSVEEGQNFAMMKHFKYPQGIAHLGLDGWWFPREQQAQTTDGRVRISVTILRWPRPRQCAAQGAGNRRGAPQPGNTLIGALQRQGRGLHRARIRRPDVPPAAYADRYVRIGATRAGAGAADRVRLGCRLPVQVQGRPAGARGASCGRPIHSTIELFRSPVYSLGIADRADLVGIPRRRVGARPDLARAVGDRGWPGAADGRRRQAVRPAGHAARVDRGRPDRGRAGISGGDDRAAIPSSAHSRYDPGTLAIFLADRRRRRACPVRSAQQARGVAGRSLGCCGRRRTRRSRRSARTCRRSGSGC